MFFQGQEVEQKPEESWSDSVPEGDQDGGDWLKHSADGLLNLQVQDGDHDDDEDPSFPGWWWSW